MLSLTIFMLMTASCMFPLHQGTVQSWMSTNKLKLNPDKTEFLLIGNERQQSKYLSMFSIGLLGVRTNPVKSARNLGVLFDKNFTFRSHISAVCSLRFNNMWDLRRIHPHLDLNSAKLFATALVSPQIPHMVKAWAADCWYVWAEGESSENEKFRNPWRLLISGKIGHF